MPYKFLDERDGQIAQWCIDHTAELERIGEVEAA